MKEKTFKLERPVKLVPVMGETYVNIETTGEVEVINCKPTVRQRERKVTLATSPCGELSRSPMGQNRTVHITLPTEEASMAAFKREIELLFDLYFINSI